MLRFQKLTSSVHREHAPQRLCCPFGRRGSREDGHGRRSQAGCSWCLEGLDERWVSLSCAWLCYRTTLLGASNGRKRSAQSPGAAGIRAGMASTQKTSNEAASHVIASRVPSEIPQVPSSTCERVLKQGLCATATCSSNFRPHHRGIQSRGGTDSPLEWRMTADEAVLADPAAPTSTSSELSLQQHPTDATADHKRA